MRGSLPQQQQPSSSAGRGPSPAGRGAPPGRGRGGPSPVVQPVAIHGGSGIPHGMVPSYLIGSASLVEELDQRIMAVLRDGKHILGTLVSFDQFNNLVLTDTVERKMVQRDDALYYSDIPLGLYVIRGESMVLAGQVGDDAPQPPSVLPMKQVSMQELEQLEPTRESLEWEFDADLIA